MSRILFALFALSLVQLAKSQAIACSDALVALGAYNRSCFDVVDKLDPSQCSGACEIEWATAVSACENNVSVIRVAIAI